MARRPGLAWLAMAGLLLGAAGLRAEPAELRFGVTSEFAGGSAHAHRRLGGSTVTVDTTIAAGSGSVTLRMPDLAARGLGDLLPETVPGGTSSARMGDLRLIGRYALAEGEPGGAPSLAIAVQTRMPSATEPSLGAAQWEQVVRLETGLELHGGAALDLSLGRRITPFGREGRGEKDYWIGQGSLAMPIAADWTAGLAAYAQDRQPDVTTPVMELGAFVERALGDDLAIGLFTWHGMTRESPAFTIGLRLAYRIRWTPARLER